MTHRRDFLKTSTLLGFGASVPGFLGRTAFATPHADKAGAKETILVVVQLTGGNDGLNTVIPRKDAEYAKLRPTIGVPQADVLKLNDDYGLHPMMDGAAKLYADGLMTIVHGVGYPNPSQSHFRSMDVWNAADTKEVLTEGWLGKAMFHNKAGAFHLGGETAPLALQGGTVKAPSIASLAEFQRKFLSSRTADATQQEAIVRSASTIEAGDNDLLDFVQRTATTTYAAGDRLKLLNKNYDAKQPYPANGLGNKLNLAAQLIDANLGARIYYVSMDGFDTHAGQGGKAGSHANLLGEFSSAVTAFVRDLEARGSSRRVTVLAFSEFGRRAKENGSQGTDHGSGAPVMLFGGGLKGGFVGEHPSLTKLHDGNLVHTVDFRRVYASVLKDRLGVEAEKVLGKGHEPLPLFAG